MVASAFEDHVEVADLVESLRGHHHRVLVLSPLSVMPTHQRQGITMRLPDWAPPEAGMARPLSAYDPSTRGRLIESQPFIDLA